MNWIIYSLINIAIFLMMSSVLLLLALAIPAVIVLCVFGMSLSFLREQKQKYATTKLPIRNIQIIKFSDIIYWLASVVRDQISRIVVMAQALTFRPAIFHDRSHQANSSATLAPRNKRP